MFSDISILNFLIYAAGIGFAAAIIYTNIQRTALSKFINFLLDNECISEQSATTIDAAGLTPLQKSIVKSAVRNQYGFKRSIKSISDETDTKNGNDEFFGNADDTRYYICDGNTEALKKKYSYKTMSTRLVILFVAALAAVVIITSNLTGWLINVITTPKTESDSGSNKIQSEQSAEESQNNVGDSSEASTEDTTKDNSEDKSNGPRIPT